MIRMNLPTLARENQDRFSSAEVQDLQDQAVHLVRQDRLVHQDHQAVVAEEEAVAAELAEEADKN